MKRDSEHYLHLAKFPAKDTTIITKSKDYTQIS